jgi:hypothetical protein
MMGWGGGGGVQYCFVTVPVCRLLHKLEECIYDSQKNHCETNFKINAYFCIGKKTAIA